YHSKTFVYDSVLDSISIDIIDGLLRKDASASDQSMGVCSNVVDVSSTITSKCRRTGRQFFPAGCNYSVLAIDENESPTMQTFASGSHVTFIIGAICAATNPYPKINTLVQFYIIYVPDIVKWDTLEVTSDYKHELIALQVTLSLYLYRYNTSIVFGTTTTIEEEKITELDWQRDTATIDDSRSSFDIITTTYDSEKFWIDAQNKNAFNSYLSLQTFNGLAESHPMDSSVGVNQTSNDIVQAIQSSIYEDPPRLNALMDNLAVSMTNGLRNTSNMPAVATGVVTSFEVYIQIQWGWMVVPIATVMLSLVFLILTMYLSRYNGIPAWKSSVLAALQVQALNCT
ncbi:MAG: hypothetical protein Q9174_006958, partial [Haloplaca sp. 1 TL-2023]